MMEKSLFLILMLIPIAAATCPAINFDYETLCDNSSDSTASVSIDTTNQSSFITQKYVVSFDSLAYLNRAWMARIDVMQGKMERMVETLSHLQNENDKLNERVNCLTADLDSLSRLVVVTTENDDSDERFNCIVTKLDVLFRVAVTTGTVLVILFIIFIVLFISRRKQISVEPTGQSLAKPENAAEINGTQIQTVNSVGSLTENDMIAYDDAVQAFVNINDSIYDLRRYNALIVPYIFWFANENQQVPILDLSSLSDETRSKVALLASRIEQFKKNYEQTITRCVSRIKPNEKFTDCLRCPLNGKFDPDLDQHLLGEDLALGAEIHSVYKLGFLFPSSRNYPYREKALII